jgi:3',5'-cyclic AMP phosphodiesterase CpdA
VPLYAVPGNHDSLDGSLDLYLQYVGAPAASYSFDYGQAHFALVDSHTGQVSAEQLAWLDADLAATRQPLKIVAVHHPPFDPNGSTHIMTGGNQAFMDLMERRGVRYVFAGHIHEYGREERNGVTYVVTGGGGAPLNPGQYYHYLKVQVRGQAVTWEVVRVR